ncbi:MULTISPECIES: TetR/AcrR family transcriptional regulator [Kribbella]|uniref:HTH tetR-type domain-containing protein n=1 Tax=Kribbella karoonensis TaxID=324851 RepID=A0ABN2ES17_9ACTN
MSEPVKKQAKRRPYRSAVRADSARRTRQAIVAAAGELFVAKGYAATSLAEVAEAAGVARPTVFAAFGSKAALLRQALDQALAGDDDPVPVAQRPWFQPVWQASAPADVLEAYAGVCVLIAGRAAPLFEAVHRAADDSPEAEELWQTLRDNRRAGAHMVLEHLLTVGSLTDGLDLGSAVDILAVFNDPAHYANLVLGRGWPEARFRGWLAAAMRSSLLP